MGTESLQEAFRGMTRTASIERRAVRGTIGRSAHGPLAQVPGAEAIGGPTRGYGAELPASFGGAPAEPQSAKGPHGL